MSSFRIGLAVIPRSAAGAVRTARFAEDTGFDTVWLGDTLGDWIDPSSAFLDPWPLFGALAERTSRIGLGVLVTNVSWRAPVQIARWTMTVDQLSRGRFALGLGCGYVDDQRMAGPDVTGMPATERVARLEESLVVLRRLLDGDTSAFAGAFTQYEGAAMAPGPFRGRRVPIVVAGVGERVMRVAVQAADRWNTFVDTSSMAEFRPVAARRLDALDRICDEHGRDPGSLQRSLTVYFEAVDVWAAPDTLRRIVEEYAPLGFDEFVVYPPAYDRFDDVARSMAALPS